MKLQKAWEGSSSSCNRAALQALEAAKEEDPSDFTCPTEPASWQQPKVGIHELISAITHLLFLGITKTVMRDIVSP
jgi:hypothetical protein